MKNSMAQYAEYACRKLKIRKKIQKPSKLVMVRGEKEREVI